MDQKQWMALGRRLIWPGLALGMLLGLGWTVAQFPAITLGEQGWLMTAHRYATPDLDRFVSWFTNLGTTWGTLPGTLLLGAWLWHRGQQRQSAFLVLAMLGALLLNLGLKGVWQRARPQLWEGVQMLPDSSFPSGHATFSMAFALAVVLLSQASPYRRWVVAIALPLALLIGLSRSYLGVHYPSDVVGGWLLAVGWTVGLHRAMFPPPN
ncbi:MAG: phosphatase PAP2 family protein [Spirulina sp.]